MTFVCEHPPPPPLRCPPFHKLINGHPMQEWALGFRSAPLGEKLKIYNISLMEVTPSHIRAHIPKSAITKCTNIRVYTNQL